MSFKKETEMVPETGPYSIRIIEDINDIALVSNWKRIQGEVDCFPQMYYEWCEPWWRRQSGKRKLHIVSVEDQYQRIVGIAPLCIEKRFGLRILRSFPIHFGDFYHFLVEDGDQQFDIFVTIIDYLNTFKEWQVVHLVNVNDRGSTWGFFQPYQSNVLSKILCADYQGMSFESFLNTLSRNTRQQFRKKLRRLEKEGVVELECIEDASGYLRYTEDMKSLYLSRWADDHTLPPDDEYYKCRNEAVQELFKKGKMALYILKLNNEIKIFRLGFKHNQTFFDWKVSHAPNIGNFSPGILIIGKIIEDLISKNYSRLNFMTGDYMYKQSWSDESAVSTNYEFFSCGSSLHARLYVQYRLVWRDKLRKQYYSLLKLTLVRTMKRWMEKQCRSIKE
jgi:CelD/BcsL family acetyltransferase involved in cellulose biosynthesis